MEINSLLGLMAVLILVAANGFFVASEFALVKVRATRIDQLVAEGHKTAKVVQAQVRHLDNNIAATQLGITLASLALGWVGEPALAHLIEPLFAWLGGPTAVALSHSLAIIIAFTIITTFHIVLGELVPKTIALQRSEAVSLFAARPLWAFAWLFRPFILLLNSLGNSIVHLVGLHTDGEHGAVHSVEELEMLVVQSHKAGILEQQEEVLLRHVFDFSEKLTQQVMIPRSEVAGVPMTITYERLARIFSQEPYTRLPVYEGSLDNIVGLLHLKDVFAQRVADERTFDLSKLVRPVLYVTETTPIDTVLALMRSKRMHLAVVIDEYGSAAGIVTLEDILEEIVGEVQDEFDTNERGVRSEVEDLPDGSASVDGLMALVSFEERFGSPFEQVHARTVGGYVFEQLDRLPVVGDVASIGEYELRVEAMDGRRIARVHVERQAHTPEAQKAQPPKTAER